MKKINLFLFWLIMVNGAIAQEVLPIELSNYDIQQNESDEFDADTLNLNPAPNSKWNDYGAWTPPGSIVWSKINNICAPRDQTTILNPYSLNPNILHATEIINGQTVTYLRLDTKYDTVYRPAPGYNTYNSCEPDTNYPYYNYQYTTATLSSIQQYKYGYFEIRSRFPSGGIADGPSYWFCCGNADYSEIDVYEKAFTCNPYSNDITVSVHNSDIDGNCTEYTGYDYNNPCYSKVNNCGYNICDPITIQSDPRLNFHTYGLDWEPDILKFYLDGYFIKQFTYEVEHINTPDCDNHGETISVNNLALQGLIISNNIDNQVPIDELPQPGQDYYYDIDYIRVYKIKPSFLCRSVIYVGGIFEFDAYQYKDFDNLVVDDNYTWTIQGGTIINFLDTPVCSEAIIQIHDTTNLVISLTAKERSKNTTYFSQYRFSSSTTNINLGKQEIIIFPNPGENTFSIIIPTLFLNEKKLILTIYNSLGENILQIAPTIGLPKMDFILEGKANGLYFATLSNGTKCFSSKFIKQ